MAIKATQLFPPPPFVASFGRVNKQKQAQCNLILTIITSQIAALGITHFVFCSMWLKTAAKNPHPIFHG